MTTRKIISLLLCMTILGIGEIYAQVFDEWEARPNISLKYKFNKRFQVGATYYLYLDKNISTYNKSVISTEIAYKVASWLKLGLDHRYGIDSKENYHDVRYSLAFDVNNTTKKWNFAWRTMLQQKFTSLRREVLEEDPVKNYWRNRLTISYEPTATMEWYVFTENYTQVKEELPFFRQKSALGLEYKIGRRSKIGGRFEVINKKNGKLVARPNISFTHTFGFEKMKSERRDNR